MSNDYIKENFHLLTYFICYLSLLIGFFYGENVTTGPKADFFHTWKVRWNLMMISYFHC